MSSKTLGLRGYRKSGEITKTYLSPPKNGQLASLPGRAGAVRKETACGDGHLAPLALEWGVGCVDCQEEGVYRLPTVPCVLQLDQICTLLTKARPQ